MEAEKHTFIYLLGPSASGKTFTVENKLLGKAFGEYKFPDYAIAIDGGDMRSASLVYQKALKCSNEQKPEDCPGNRRPAKYGKVYKEYFERLYKWQKLI